jgi:cytochrome c
VNAASATTPAVPQAQLAANNCLVCHGIESKLVGPGFVQVADKYRERTDALDYLKSRVRDGSSGVWGEVPMPAAPQISDADLDSIARWLKAGAPH